MFRLVASLSLVCSAVAVAQEGTTEQATAPDPLHPQFKMTTTLGDIILELDAEKAPVTVLNFYHYADNGYYSGTVFHRVINSFMIQGGGFTVELDKKDDGLLAPIKNEWRNGLKNNSGTISMARLGGNPDSATSQFFINVVDNDRLDRPQPDGAAYAVFGKVVNGMDVVEAIRYTEVENHPKYPSRSPVTPATPVVIESVTLLTEFDRTRVEAIVKEREEAEAKAALEAQGAIKKEMDTAARKIEGEQGKRFTTTASGLRYLTLVEGTGETPGPTDQVQVHYTGWLLDGTEFDSSYKPRPNLPEGQPFTFSLKGGVIKGWMEGVATMKVGEKRKLLIPPDLAYGKAGFRDTIPPNAILMFDVELLGIK